MRRCGVSFQHLSVAMDERIRGFQDISGCHGIFVEITVDGCACGEFAERCLLVRVLKCPAQRVEA